MTPEIKDWGHFILVDSSKLSQGPSTTIYLSDSNCLTFSYMVMPKYGTTIHELFHARKGRFTPQSIYSLGIQLINILEQIHSAGQVFNDLKLDNLLFDLGVDVTTLRTTEENIFAKYNVNIIDFGFVCPYVDHESNEHLEKVQLDIFRGNMVFSSINQLKFHSTSRRDDLISLFYLLVYLMKGGNLPGTSLANSTDVNQEFQHIRDVKIKQRTHDLCFGNTKGLTNFKREVFSYRFKDEPRYDYLRDLLTQLRDNSESEARPCSTMSSQSLLNMGSSS